MSPQNLTNDATQGLRKQEPSKLRAYTRKETIYIRVEINKMETKKLYKESMNGRSGCLKE